MPPTTTVERETESQKVERWRAYSLLEAGYDADTAHEIAARPDIDLHHAIRLVESGCPPALARDILL